MTLSIKVGHQKQAKFMQQESQRSSDLSSVGRLLYTCINKDNGGSCCREKNKNLLDV